MLKKYIPLVARSFLAVIFIYAGLNKVFNFAGTSESMAKAGLPIVGVLLVFTIAFQILGGLSIILGYKAEIGAILLIIFMIPATIAFHNPLADPSQVNNFFKNLSIIGGLLLVLVYGSGPLSLDQSDRSSYVSQSEESIMGE
ncbi:DoxX family protein [Anabaena subtropica]|uniref:DoxX family protein n=1 Tax=Anabaena subtropica FACHB-260 TaxID=2692884 RepID=A0ABR8CMX0_9NOST|nr:DoxX family protein [Anabaena subtropica]MBD2344582.1 DoxX family protein [Anabaena subtropica FACHB-260]